MSKIELVKLAYNGDGAELGFYLSDDFHWTDELGTPPIDKSSWVAMGKLMESAFGDYSLIIDDIKEEGDDLLVTSRFSGTFIHDLDLSSMGLGVIPATGKAFASAPQRDRVSFDGDKISELHNLETGPDSGMAGILKALGVKMG